MTGARRRPRGLSALALIALLSWSRCEAGQFRYCDPPVELDAAEQDRVLRLAAVVKETLDASGGMIAIVARSGLDLGRFGLRYSHAGVSLRTGPSGPWSIRQLYFDCDERRPRLFDEGVTGFLVGAGDGEVRPRFLSAVLIPGAQGALDRLVRDAPRALGLVGAAYSANAYAFGQRYQNCNQWVAEMLGVAWGALDDGADLRARAQRWLQHEGFVPTRFDVGNPLLMGLAAVLPFLHLGDHPPEDLEAGRFRVSMPQSIEAFVRAREPAARRVEFCQIGRRVVIRQGWTPLDPGCTPGSSDTVVEFAR